MKKIIMIMTLVILVTTLGCVQAINVNDSVSDVAMIGTSNEINQQTDGASDEIKPPRPDSETDEKRPPRPEGETDENRPPRPDGETDENRPPRPEGETDENRPPRPDGETDEDRPPRPDGETDEDRPPRPEDEQIDGNNENGSKYSIDQAVSDNAQLTTIAFSGLAFLTGTEGADAFFPPGKVADFFGFQYMRDVDVSGYGHNTTFLTKVASNMLYILNDDQIEILKELAMEQEELYETYGYGRLDIINAFRQHYEEGETLDYENLTAYSSYLYEIDGELSYKRAEAFAKIISTLTDEQIEYIDQMSFNDSSTWPDIDEEGLLDKRSMSHLSHVAVMTYASEFFSWYAGSTEADVYFCPERHGTYFGGFYMKDYPAMNNPEYFISTSVTGDSGKEFLEILTDEQRARFTTILDEQREGLDRIVEIRNEVVTLLRGLTTEGTDNEAAVMTLMKEYGVLEGEMSYRYATRFTEIGNSLTDEQNEALYELRNQYIFPEGTYLYSAPIDMIDITDSDLIK